MNEWIRQLVVNMGYVGLALLTFVENVFPPLPSEVILPLGGFLASQGRLTLAGVVLAGTAGSLMGAVVLYYVGRWFSQERLERWATDHGAWLLLTANDVQQAFDWFGRHGRAVVFFGRLVPGIRSLISIPAGACGMRMAPFLLYTALGTALWSALLAYGGNLLGEQYESLGRVLRWATYAVIALLLVAIISWAVKRRRSDE
ncbi:MAG TPA: DedA family protein [Candidatus Sulfomarinibacteraceae bacterium]|nr:DedA family protein [Candidatus Sulfomarinibacteraceae bacterium]